MATLQTTATQTEFDATMYANDVAQTRNSQREWAATGSKGGFMSWFNNSNYSVVGINTARIPEMRTAIRNYVERINEHLGNIKTTTDPTIALKGTGMEEAVKTYIGEVVDYCTALCSNLLAFSDKLAKVEEAWRASDTNMSSSVNGASSGLSSAAGQTYTEKF